VFKCHLKKKEKNITSNSSSKKHRLICHIPNILTIIRLIIIPFIIISLLRSETYTAILLTLVCLGTDFFDGQLARRFKCESRFGQLLDPLADKLLFGSILFTLLIKEKLFTWLTIFTVLALLFIIGFIIFAKKEMKVKNSGRVLYILQIMTLLVFILGYINNYTLGLFLGLLLINLMVYIIEYNKSNKKRVIKDD
jgi:cardiolipin synthase (CMP-forming)